MIDTPASTTLPKSLYVLLVEACIFCLILLAWVILVSWNNATPIAPVTFLVLSLVDAFAALGITVVLSWYRGMTEKIAIAYDILVTSVQLTVCVVVAFFLTMICSTLLPAASRYWIPNILYEPAFEFLQPEWLLQLQSVGLTAFISIYCTGMFVLVIVLRPYVQVKHIQTAAPVFRVFLLILVLLQNQLVRTLERMCSKISDCQFALSDLPLQNSYESMWELVIITLCLLFIEVLYLQELPTQTLKHFAVYTKNVPMWVVHVCNRSVILAFLLVLVVSYDTGLLPVMSTFLLLFFLVAVLATVAELYFHLVHGKTAPNKTSSVTKALRFQEKRTPLLRLMTIPTKKEL